MRHKQHSCVLYMCHPKESNVCACGPVHASCSLAVHASSRALRQKEGHAGTVLERGSGRELEGVVCVQSRSAVLLRALERELRLAEVEGLPPPEQPLPSSYSRRQSGTEAPRLTRAVAPTQERREPTYRADGPTRRNPATDNVRRSSQAPQRSQSHPAMSEAARLRADLEQVRKHSRCPVRSIVII